MSEDKDFFERLSAQFEEQDKKLKNQEADEDFFKRTQKKHEDFFKQSTPKTDEDFFKRQEAKHKAFFEGTTLPDEEEKDKSGDADPTFFSSISRPLVIQEVQKDGMFLEKVAERYGDDIEIVSLAVENNAGAFAFASQRLQSNSEVAQLFVDTKKLAIKEAQQKSTPDTSVILALQEQIETINRIHRQAVEKKEQHNYMGMSM